MRMRVRVRVRVRMRVRVRAVDPVPLHGGCHAHDEAGARG